MTARASCGSYRVQNVARQVIIRHVRVTMVRLVLKVHLVLRLHAGVARFGCVWLLWRCTLPNQGIVLGVSDKSLRHEPGEGHLGGHLTQSSRGVLKDLKFGREETAIVSFIVFISKLVLET